MVRVVLAELLAWLRALGSSAVYATIIVTFGIQVARVEGESMAPTLENQDRLVVNKFIYRVDTPKPGDVVMMYYPADPDKTFVKRYIAGEGDTVRIVSGHVFVNDKPIADSYVAGEHRSRDDWGPEVVPDGFCFVLGDNRSNSSDSRVFGFVPRKYVVGKVQFRWWPLSALRAF
ncbi:MAG TPA: signal peptidase I [Vicinamibacterales bacterium]|nr:signal peptidase I [Vicinamibacterales bacterium]